ncbi:hypothetical protein [Wolbachia endosymbiont of Ctenocephalides felis wCfeJ]|uniref:hypothetical protein n=1 Tax=Wolbachia endosymbiont of Ctenocephalides felis wCfeJ TaxID=2732594 RepID=UPI001FED15B8|nr:hypothetical protein [Wolbachia endosymbiont of Ctenocephalides felis wCfeJ]WCR58216.1 MAG: Chromosome partition protein Smc [Wolbachia endosymbiont of Ctenocephalides felis wCfeJ]
MKQEDLFVIKNQSLGADEQKKNDILSIIESCNSLKDTVRELEKEKLVWYFIGPLLQDKDIRRQVISKWGTDFQEFEQSIIKTQNGIRNKFEKILSGQSFSAYSTKDNNFNIRFEDEEKPIKISDILRVSNEDEVYNLFLGGDSQIIACKKNSNERHYNFTGASSCEMAIYWQAKDSRGNDISCSIAVAVGSGGIQRIIGEPRFGDLKFMDPLPEETKNEILKLVEQNKEVFINEKTLYQVFADIYKNVNVQQKTEERITQDPYISPQSPMQDSSGYSSLGTPSSRRSSISTNSELEDDTFSSEEECEQDELKDERSFSQRISSSADEIINEIEELKKEKEILAQNFAKQAKRLEDLQLAISEKDQKIKEQDALIKSLTDQNKDANEVLKENTYLKQQNAELKDRNTKITEEGDVQISKLIKEEQTLKQEVEGLKEEVKRLQAELEGKVKELVGKDRNLKQQINALEQSQENKDTEIADLKSELLGLKSQLRDERNKSQSTNKINEELREKLEISEAELNKSKAENTKLRDDMKKISEGSDDDHNKQLAEFLLEKDKELTDVTDQLSKEQLKNQELAKELSQLQKEKEALEREIQQSNVSGKSLADEMKEVDENKDKKIGSLREEVKQKGEKIQQIIKENQKLEGKLQVLDKKYSEVKNKDEEYIKSLTYKLNQAESELINNQGKLTDQIEKLKEEKENLLEQLRTKSTDSASFRKQQSEIDRLTQQLKKKEEMLINTQKELESVKERLEELQNVLKQGEGQTVVVSTQTEVGYESRGIQASIQQHHVETETTMPETRDQDTQAVDKSSNKIVSGLRQENKNLTRDKQTISEQLKQKVREIEELKERLKKSQEENKQLKQKVTKGTGVDASSSTDQEETKEMEVQTDVQVSNFHDLYDKEGRYVRTELSDPNLTPNDPEKSR